MVLSSLNSNREFHTYPQAIQRALAYLQSHDIDSMEPGNYPIEGEKMFAVVSDLTTRAVTEIPPEIHRKYIDVQYWQSGRERFGIAPNDGTDAVVRACPEKDVWYLEGADDESFVNTRPGSFAVFYPWDVHRPGCMTDRPETFRKCVIKVSMELL